jgi:hypothetical protein
MSTDEEVIQRIDEEIKKLTDKLNKLPENDFTNRGIASKAIADQEILKGAKLSEMHTKEQEAINAARREARREAAVRRESARLEAVRVEAAAAREEKIARQPGEREATATRNLEENAAAVKKYANRENSAKIIQKRYRDNISRKNIEEAAQSAREDTAREIINNNCSNALSWPNNLQEALTILGLGTSETFFNLPNITKSLNDAYDKKNLQCVNYEVQGLDIQSYNEYKRNISKAKTIIEQHIIQYNSKKCANANDQPKNVEQALFILGFGTIDELLSQQNANELLDNAYKNKTDACAKYVGFDKVSQNKYKYNIDQAKNIIKEQIALARRPETPEQIKTKLARDQAINSAKGLTAQINSRLEENKKMAEKYAAVSRSNAEKARGIKLNTEAETKSKKEDKQLQDLQDLPKDIDKLSTLLANPEQSSSSGASVETNQTDKVIYPIISDDAGSNSSRARSDTSISMSTLTNSATSSPTSSRANSISAPEAEQGQGPVQGQEQKPVQGLVSGSEISETEFNNAIVAIKHLFNMKTINDLKLSNVTIKKDNLLKKIAENRPQDKDQITNIINEAFNFYKFAHEFKSSIPFTEIKMFRDYIRYDYMDGYYKKLLKQIYDNFYEDYKTLGFSNSNIYLKPNSNNNQTRKNQSNILCDKISQLIQPMYSNRTIPSQIPNLTKINITKKVVKDEIKRVREANDKATAEAKEKEEANKKKEKARKELNILLEQVKKDTNTKETEAIRRDIAKLTNKLTDNLSDNLSVSDIKKINKEIANLEGMLKSGVKGGTRKRILIANRKKNFKTKVTRKR